MRRSQGEEGSTLPELVVASSLTLVAVAAALSAAAGPLHRWTTFTADDVRRAEVEAAADTLARLVRSARPDLGSPAILEVRSDGLILRVGPPSDGARVSVTVEEGALVSRSVPESVAVDPLPERLLLDGVEDGDVHFAALGADGSTVGMAGLPGSDPTVAVSIALEVDGHRATRVVALRDRSVHERAVGW